MKKILLYALVFVLFFTMYPNTAFTQMSNSAHIVVNNGWHIKTLDYKHLTNGQIDLKGSMYVSNDWTNTSASANIFTASSNGIVYFNGSGLQNIIQNSNFVNIELLNDVTIDGNMIVSGNINLFEKEISGTGDFELKNNATAVTTHSNGLNGNLTMAGSVVLNAGANYIYSGTLAQQTGSLLPANVNNLTIDKASNNVGLTRTGITYVNGNLSILSGSFIINSESALTVAGSTIIEGTQGLVLESDADGTASFIDNGISGSGNVKTSLFIPYNVFGSPVSTPVSSASQDLFDGSDAAYFYDPTTANWANFTSGDMDIMRGYWTRFPDAEKTIDFIDVLNTGTYSFTDLYRTAQESGNFGWNFIGNPYPSAIDWDEVIAINGGALPYVDSTMLNNAVYFPDGNGGVNAYNGVGLNEFTGIIPPFSGMWVQVNKEKYDPAFTNIPLDSAQIKFNNSVRTHELSSSKNNKQNADMLRLFIEKGQLKDECLLRLHQNATSAFDPAFDAYKKFSDNNNIPQLYMVMQGNEFYSINAINDNITAHVAIQLGYKATPNQTVKITADLSAFDITNLSVHLEDLLTSTLTDLRLQNNYSFTATSSAQDNQRFILHLGLLSNTVEHSNLNTSEIYAYNNAVYVTGLKENVVFTLYNILGQELYSEIIEKSHSIIQPNIPTGHYIVKILGQNTNQTKKIFIN